MRPLTARGRFAIVGATATVLVAVAAGYVWHAARRGERPVAVGSADSVGSVGSVGSVTLAPGPRLLTVTDRHIASVSTGDPGGPRTVSDVKCVRVYAAAGTGICVAPQTPWSYAVVVLDAELRPQRTVAIPGLPSRARVSPSGRLVAWTTFVGGDSYTSAGLSTRTGILDTRTGAVVPSLETFAVTREGRPYRAVDVNYWGVTFAGDDNRFYATLSTAGRRYLVEGDLAARAVRTLSDDVECPSLSPDGTRIAFKRAIGGDPRKGWRLSVMDLATLAVTPLAETASVDDQAAWLDGSTLAYTLRQPDGRPDVWSVPADGTGAPRLLVPGAESPAPLS